MTAVGLERERETEREKDLNCYEGNVNRKLKKLHVQLIEVTDI